MHLQLGFMASHNGSSMKAIIEAIKRGEIDAEARVVLSNNSRSTALSYAREHNIPAYHLSEKTIQTPEQLDKAIRDTLLSHNVQLVVLSGYMKKVGPLTLAAYRERILNVHPALLPKYGGQGMYGKHVHAAVLAAGDKVSGVTIHLVDDQYDHGPVVGQREVLVLESDTIESLAERIQQQEKALYVEVLQHFSTRGLPVHS